MKAPRTNLSQFKTDKTFKMVQRFSVNANSKKRYAIGIAMNFHSTGKCWEKFLAKDKKRYPHAVYTQVGYNHQPRAKCKQCGKELDPAMAEKQRKEIARYMKESAIWKEEYPKMRAEEEKLRKNKKKLDHATEATDKLAKLLG